MLSRHSILLIGDPKTGKTQSIKNLLGDTYNSSIAVNSSISLYCTSIKDLPDNTINLTVWDCSGEIRDLNYFMLINHISTCLIFCNLLNSNSCDRLEYWKEVIRKYHKYAQIVVIGTYTATRKVENADETVEPDNFFTERQLRTIEKNKIKVLEWCVDNDDTPFFEIDLNNNNEIIEMYNSIFIDRLEKYLELG